MAQRPLDDTVKVRAPKGLRRDLQRIADKRFLTVSDIAREALRSYVAAEFKKISEKPEVVA
jgi:predicted transcriptional regulator